MRRATLTDAAGLEAEGNAEALARTAGVVRAVQGAGLVEAALLKERLDLELLDAAGLVAKEAWKGKLVRINTRLFYTQTKYNLLREENEGFAKLIAELHSAAALRPDAEGALVAHVEALIGTFDLDPNRVLDVVLDALEAVLAGHVAATPAPLVRLAARFQPLSVRHVLGFRFRQYHGADAEPTPPSLFRAAAVLVKAGLVGVDDLWPHLAPADDEATAWHEERVRDMQAAARKVGQVSLASKPADEAKPADAKAADAPATAAPGAAAASSAARTKEEREREAAAKEAKKKEEEKAAAATAAGGAAEGGREARKDRREDQKLGLLAGLLREEAWAAGEPLLMRLRHLDPAAQPAVAAALAARLHAALEGPYRLLCPSLAPLALSLAVAPAAAPAAPAAWDLAAFLAGEGRLLHILGVHVARDVLLCTKLWRLVKEPLRGAQREAAQELVAALLLPALSLSSPNPALAAEAWESLRVLPPEARFTLYGQWRAAPGRHPALLMARAQAVHETKRVMRRLSKDNVKQLGRFLGKLSHAQPVAVLEVVLDQIQAYDNLIAPVVDSLRYLSVLSLDAFAFLLLDHLATRRQTMKADGMHAAAWLTGVATVCGAFYRRFPWVELAPLLQYTANRLKEGSAAELLVLRELFGKMAAVDTTEEHMNADQIAALAGGETLRTESAVRRPTIVAF